MDEFEYELIETIKDNINDIEDKISRYNYIDLLRMMDNITDSVEDLKTQIKNKEQRRAEARKLAFKNARENIIW